ncbi:bifunctional diaminohydroxyphosphoribosylaminopyrimidine deaminase/5-amino-6-(5-phosphoribosylamino)uracil reductase RibD [Buchnera aphidicola]|uniref:Riboflavin biosynthesis protein RibD n=1 Tax=Buchnera aphidicola (Stegophylla sp.) TaxID=2315800 RepID=A0A4D6YJ27_9GAMM|nr:bifunctional diaminohydroxyphosphoribosylaminopyrimidine deaminase/5-amino-6-(5-phosphoribosylamino)uracil reductase RibD [Buchnera aphidicola (Stegophylla sp.)]QCI26441.1 bifunctional diaminohydroxyphosphoribosylaminopyrimidine deaminase/5-amino-6-(5-phosphoribosylamino)uracil reductase RibD [Buchnera aphidicola (Stegophylla sp.)]
MRDINKQTDIFYMKKAIQLAKKGQYTTQSNPNVGCIIVKNNKIIGIGWHIKPNTNHAEINALNMAGNLAYQGTAYISLEPCSHFGKTPPCCYALVQSGITRIVISALDPNPCISGNGIKYLKKSNIKITTGILLKQSKKINYGFFKRMQTNIPWIQIKMATSIDGKIAMHNGESKWITSPKSIQDVHKFRLLSTAILSTSQTIMIDNPLLTARPQQKNKMNYPQPIRIIIDSKNKIQPYHKFINELSTIWLIRIKKDNNFWPNHVKQIILPPYKNKINLIKLFNYLGQKNINAIWIECGAILFSKLLYLNIIDELIIYIAPKMLGHLSKPLYIMNKKIRLHETLQLKFKTIKFIGSDLRIILTPYKKINT